VKKKLKDICTFTSGYAWSASEFKNAGIPIVKIGNLNSQKNDFDYWQGEYDEKYLIRPGDLLVSLSGTIKVHIWDGPEALLNQRIVKISSKGQVNQDWVYYQISNVIKEIAHKGKKAVIRNVSIKDLKNFEVNIPKIETQNKIAAVLNRAKGLLSKQNRKIELLNDLLRAQFFEMFGDLGNPSNKWPKKPVKKVCENKTDIRCGPFGTQLSKSDYRKEGVPLWGIKHINSKFSENTDEFVSREKAKELKNYSLEPRDIVMTRKGNIGNTHVYPENLESGIMHSDILRIRVDEDIINPYFLSYQFRFNKEVKWQINKVSPGVVMAGINVSKLRDIQIRVPDKKLQDKFEKIYKNIDRLKSTILTAHFSNLFNSILQRAFDGQINFHVKAELDALLKEININLKENDLSNISTDIAFLQNLVDRLNEQDFSSKALYDKAKHVVFLLQEEGNQIEQVYNSDGKNSLKIAVK